MRMVIEIACCGFVIGVAGTSAGDCRESKQHDDAAIIECVATKAMIVRANLPKSEHRVLIEPLFASAEDAPGYDALTSRARPAGRSRALAEAFGGRVRQVKQQGYCPSCDIRGNDLLITLSEPIVAGDSAQVTLTALYEHTPGKLAYETVRFTLARRAGSWTIVKGDQLGYKLRPSYSPDVATLNRKATLACGLVFFFAQTRQVIPVRHGDVTTPNYRPRPASDGTLALPSADASTDRSLFNG
jgi:hypothetical protein